MGTCSSLTYQPGSCTSSLVAPSSRARSGSFTVSQAAAAAESHRRPEGQPRGTQGKTEDLFPLCRSSRSRRPLRAWFLRKPLSAIFGQEIVWSSVASGIGKTRLRCSLCEVFFSSYGVSSVALCFASGIPLLSAASGRRPTTPATRAGCRVRGAVDRCPKCWEEEEKPQTPQPQQDDDTMREMSIPRRTDEHEVASSRNARRLNNR